MLEMSGMRRIKPKLYLPPSSNLSLWRRCKPRAATLYISFLKVISTHHE